VLSSRQHRYDTTDAALLWLLVLVMLEPGGDGVNTLHLAVVSFVYYILTVTMQLR